MVVIAQDNYYLFVRMLFTEAGEILEMFRSSFPLSFLFFVPIFILISPVSHVYAAQEFTAYRMQQFDLQGSSYGETLLDPVWFTLVVHLISSLKWNSFVTNRSCKISNYFLFSTSRDECLHKKSTLSSWPHHPKLL